MATTYPLPTLAASVSATGITAPAYPDILLSLQTSFQTIYGSDSYITPDSQDGQLLAIVAKAIKDTNDMAIAIYNAFSPATAQGAALSSNVKINGISRAIASSSSVILTVGGSVGAIILGGVVSDAAGNKWNLPATVTIPLSGTINVTATCALLGAITAAPNTLNLIVTPTLGWQTVTNASAANAGAPVESDAALRQRQTIAVIAPSRTVLDGIKSAVQALVGVTQAQAYENDTNLVDTNGLPPHSMALVVSGGNVLAIANAINLRKTPGAYTYGTTSQAVSSVYGIPGIIRFFVTTLMPVKASVSIKALAGYNSAIGAQILAAVQAYINALSIGQQVSIGHLYLPAQLFGAAGIETFELINAGIQIAPVGSPLGLVDIATAFNAQATCALTDLTLVVS